MFALIRWLTASKMKDMAGTELDPHIIFNFESITNLLLWSELTLLIYC